MGTDRYADLRGRERPRHEGDDFSRRHPQMPLEERAKIFMPFAALRGFGEVLGRTLPEEEHPRELTGEEREELDRQLALTARWHAEGRHVMLRADRVTDSGTESLSGLVTAVSMEAGYLKVMDRRVAFGDIVRLEAALVPDAAEEPAEEKT